MTSERDVHGWAAGLDDVVDRIAPRFGRAEPRRRAGAYLRGLLAPVDRKNGWQLAEAAGDATPDGVQEFLLTDRAGLFGHKWLGMPSDRETMRFGHLAQIHGFVGDGSPAVCHSVRKR